MERELPIFEIAGVPFIVDVDFNLLRHPQHPRLVYDFFDDMEDNGKGYSLYIDPKTLQPVLPGFGGARLELLTVDVPYMVRLDPAGIKEKFGYQKDDLPQSDLLLRPSPNILSSIQKGQPATIYIGLEKFFIDTTNGYLMAPGIPSEHWLNLNGMPRDQLRTCYRLFYDPVTKKEFKPIAGEPLPQAVIAVEIPHIRFADSFNYKRVNWSSFQNFPEQEYYRRFPVRESMNARIVEMGKVFASKTTLSVSDKIPEKHSNTMSGVSTKKSAHRGP